MENHHQVDFFTLNTGADIPSIAVGLANINPVSDIIISALKLGYHHLDCAPVYNNQKQIGDVLKKVFEDGVVKREELFVTSKLWSTDHLPEDVPAALDRTLQDLQLDYVDLYLIHWPVSLRKGSEGYNPEDLTQPDIPSTWRAMEALYDSGKARAIGVCNFSIKKLEDLLAIARVPPAVNQVECHLMWQQPKLRAFCQSKGIHLSGYSPLGGQPSQNQLVHLLENQVLKMVAEKLGRTPAQVALRWGLQMGHSVLPRTSNLERLKDNFDVFNWSIPEELLVKFSEIEQVRLINPVPFVHEKYGAYKTLEELWDGE